MPKLSKKKFDEYKKVDINGFKVNLYKLIYKFAHGDEYPQLTKTLISNDDIELNIIISFFKYYNKTSVYKIEVLEYKKDKNSKFMTNNSLNCFKKTYYQDKKDSKHRFSFKHLKEICGNFTEQLQNEILEDYRIF